MRVFSLIYAVPFLVIGILGVIPEAWPLMSKSIGLSIVYLITGAWLVWVVWQKCLFIRYSLQVIAVAYALLVLAGFFFRWFGTGANDWFQFIVMVPAFIVGCSKEEVT